MPRVDRRPRRRLPIEQRRAAILTAAQSAFAASPYDQVSLAAVAEVAGASEALVHRYFATKGELYVEIVGHAIDDLQQRLAAADADIGGDAADGWQRVAVSIDAYLDFVADSGEGWAAPLRSPDSGFTPAFEIRSRARGDIVGMLQAALSMEPAQPRDHLFFGYLGFLDAVGLAWEQAGCPATQRSSITSMALGALSGALAALAAEEE